MNSRTTAGRWRQSRSGARTTWLAVVFCMLAFAAGCGGGDDGAAQEPGTTATTSVSARELGVGTRTLTFVDETRGTDAVPDHNLPGRDARTIEVILQYPIDGGSAEEDTAITDAPPADDRFPLVVLSHGLTGTGSALQSRSLGWARAGYIVALPTFPLSSGDGGIRDDYPNQPADVSFVIDSILRLDADSGDPLHGHVDVEHIAAAGHSLGGLTTLGATYNSCCIDERIDAAISIAGFEEPFPGGDFADRPATPLLLIHGQLDRVIPIDSDNAGDALFQTARPPAHYLRFPQGDHMNMLQPGDLAQVVDDTMLAFLDTYLRSDTGRLDELAATVDDKGLAAFESRT